MRELIIKKGFKRTLVKMYDDIDQMPIDVFQKANKYWMLSDQIGTSMSEIEEKHLKKIAFVAKDEKKVLDAVGKLSNAIYMILNETNVESMAFACLVHSIDGKEATDRSEAGLKKTLKELSDRGLTVGEVKKKTSGKKFTQIWNTIFPNSLRTQRA